MMKVKLNSADAIAPKRANHTDAGLDLYSPSKAIVLPRESTFIDLGFAMEIPAGFVGLIFARSGLGSKFGIRPRNCVGVIDSEYRGNVGMMVENASDFPYEINKGDRIAQMVIMPISLCDVFVVDSLSNTDRGTGGFGSSGK